MIITVKLPPYYSAPEPAFPADMKLGDLVEGHGVYIGTYSVMDTRGKTPRRLSRIFNAFAAPEDLPQLMTYEDTVKYVAQLKNHHGHNGVSYESAGEFYLALRDGSYKGGWIIPPMELLSGRRLLGVRAGALTQEDNLFDLKDLGAFKGTFTTENPDFTDGFFPDWYWSSTPGKWTYAHGSVCFNNACNGETQKNNRLSCRPVRLVELA